MKKIAAIIAAIILACLSAGGWFVARAGVTCSVPFQLQNATIADATQVMANYNALVACLANAAAAGANNDITSLAALSTPITNAQGGTSIYTSNTLSAGSANAQIVTPVFPSNFSLVSGAQVVFEAGFTNTGPTTINVVGTGPIALWRRTQLGISPAVGGEIGLLHIVTLVYDGTHYQIISSGPDNVGQIMDYAGSSAPAGWAFIDGSCQLKAGAFADLFSVIGTTYDPTGSTCDVAHFALPDGRGRVLPGQDTMGVNGAANRITNAGSGCTGSTIGGAGCGLQNHTLTIPELPIVTPTGTVAVTINQNNVYQGGNPAVAPGASGNTPTTIGGLTATATFTGTPFGSGNAHSILNPLQIVTKIIKL